LEAEAFPCETRKFCGVHALLFTFFRGYGIMRLQRTNPIEEEASMTYRIFLVEDDHSIASGLQHQLEQWDFEVQVVQNFRGVLTECTAFDPHLILMDIMLPCYDGYHWCREIRRVSEVPIIFLSSASDNLNLIMAVNMGGDDFIAKPFDWNVLLAKIQALLRRTYDFGGQAAPLEHRGAVLNPSDAVLTYQGMRMELTKNEYRILQALLEQKGKVVSRETLMERLWATDSFVDENTLTVNVNRLRKKLDKAGLHDFIRTKVGMGYLIEQE
jgi:two-component system response regulator protein BraR/BceR